MGDGMRAVDLQQQEKYWKGSFVAMASPCDVLMEVKEKSLANEILTAVADEAWRIENKFSRYKTGNIIDQINTAEGKLTRIDEETSRLLVFSNELFELSEGMFDVTSGILRQIWTFDGSDHLPEEKQVEELLEKIGWQNVTRTKDHISLPDGMEIDLGGLGKEYAVDRCIQVVRDKTQASVLINFGGDLGVTAVRENNACWSVGRLITGSNKTNRVIQLYRGSIATSGNANRYLVKEGLRYCHILNPKTGWPVSDAPDTISVAAATCVEAGMLSTLAMLQGGQAEAFLQLQEVEYWIN